MKTFHALILLAIAGCVTLASTALCQAEVAKTVGAATNATSRIPKSVFDESIGKDPFFPRRSVASVANVVSGAPRPSDFTLNGITPFGAKPNAIINGRTFLKGESDEVKIPGGGKVLVRCVDIKEDSVIISVDNSPQTVEIRMRPGF